MFKEKITTYIADNTKNWVINFAENSSHLLIGYDKSILISPLSRVPAKLLEKIAQAMKIMKITKTLLLVSRFSQMIEN